MICNDWLICDILPDFTHFYLYPEIVAIKRTFMCNENGLIYIKKELSDFRKFFELNICLILINISFQ